MNKYFLVRKLASVLQPSWRVNSNHLPSAMLLVPVFICAWSDPTIEEKKQTKLKIQMVHYLYITSLAATLKFQTVVGAE